MRFTAAILLGACNVIGGIDSAEPECRMDGVTNGRETGVDCGGPCGKCEDFKTCTTDADCANGVCDESVCQPATCDDGRKNGYETDFDCGSFNDECPRCLAGGACLEDFDCASDYLPAPACVDGHCKPLCCFAGDFEDCEGCATCNACVANGFGSNCDMSECLDPFSCIQTGAGPYICQ